MKYICSMCGEIYDYKPEILKLEDCPKSSCKGKILDVEEMFVPIVRDLRSCNCKLDSVRLKGVEDRGPILSNSVVFDSVAVTLGLELISGKAITDGFIEDLISILPIGYTVERAEKPSVFVLEKEVVVEPNSDYFGLNGVLLICDLVLELYGWVNVDLKEFMKYYDVSWCEGEEDSEDMDRSIVNDEEECSFRD